MTRTAFKILLLTVLFSLALPAQERRQEEAEDYYRKWLDEDVAYIITDEERAVFENLTTEDEKARFVEQFWLRRDTDPRTSFNEFKEEHYRRIAYANDHFSVGVPGWKSDRGRVYIIHGEPDSIEHHDQGEQYYRPASEGGGVTATYAWQSWYYRNVEGVGSGLTIEFVDRTMSGHYVLARDAMDKDATLWIPGLGLTESERLGGGTKSERIGARTLANEAARRTGDPLRLFTRNDDLFERLRRYTMMQAAPDIQFKDLERMVDANVSYNQLKYEVRIDRIRVTPEDYLAPATFFFPTEEFTAQHSGLPGGSQRARLNVYGRVEDLGRRTVYAFDEVVNLNLTEDGRRGYSVFQRSLPLKPGRYKLVSIVKDINSEKVGMLETGIHIAQPSEDPQLEMSGLILADRVSPAKDEEFISDPFVLSSVKVFPTRDAVYKRGSPLGFYFEIYNVTADQQTLEPSLQMDLKIEREGEEIKLPFQNLEQLLHRYSDRFFAGSMLSTQPLSPGTYRITVTITDRIANKTAQQSASFKVVGAQPSES
ncbi:MAG TPA: GWxTD domain-containing protein [Acidobacteriota bacterium]|nr:GWxTD domain-containing protein [Acidobacteriota bacterium]